MNKAFIVLMMAVLADAKLRDCRTGADCGENECCGKSEITGDLNIQTENKCISTVQMTATISESSFYVATCNAGEGAPFGMSTVSAFTTALIASYLYM